jgi:hypothetical protein
MDHWWVPGMGVGYEHTFVHAAADFLADLGDGKKRVPDFAEGLRTQRVCDAILASAKKGAWLKTVIAHGRLQALVSQREEAPMVMKKMQAAVFEGNGVLSIKEVEHRYRNLTT